MRNPIKALVCVYSACPTAQSEPLNGYKFARELSRVADVRVIAHVRDKGEMSKTEFADRTLYAGSGMLADALRKTGQKLFGKESWHPIGCLDFLDYVAFDLHCVRLARKLRAEFPFDLVHRVTPTTVRFPTTLWRLGVPLVMGPQCGGMSWPDGFRHLALSEKSYDFLRPIGDLLHALVRDFDRASCIIVGTRSCQDLMPARYQEKIFFMCQNGMDKLPPAARFAGDAKRLLFVGRLVPFKCPDIVLRVLARLPEEVTLTVVGDGPERAGLERLAAELGVSARARFTGWVPRSETARYYREAGVFVYPSVRESTGAVILEAMASGLPVIAPDWVGPPMFLGGGCGVLVPPTNPKQLEDDILATLRSFLRDPARARDIGRKARQRVQSEWLWEQKGRILTDLYARILRDGSFRKSSSQ